MAVRRRLSAALIFVLFLGSIFAGLIDQDASFAAEPLWTDPLDGKAESGAASFSGPNSTGQAALKGVSWVKDGIGQAASLGSMDSYIGYSGSRLKPDQGTILFRFKPISDLAGSFAARSPLWTDYGQAKPPQEGFLLDTIGWNGAPKGAFALLLNPATGGNLSFLAWDGSKWHSAVWKTPDGWRWDPSRWYEIGVTWGPGGMGIFLDGEMKANLADVVSISNSIPWFLGQAPWSWPYGPHSIMGTFDEVRVYGEQLGPYQPSPAAGATTSQPPAPANAGSAGAPAPGGAAVTAPSSGTGTDPAPKAAPPTAAPAGATGGAVSPPAATTKPDSSPSGGATPAPAVAAQKPAQPAGGSQPAPGGTSQGSPPSAPPQTSGTGGAGDTASGVQGIPTELTKALTRMTEDVLPGGPTGEAAKTARLLPGGPAAVWAIPVVLLAALGLFVIGGRRRRRDQAQIPIQPNVTPLSQPPAEGAPRFCEACGSQLQPGASFCGKCGGSI